MIVSIGLSKQPVYVPYGLRDLHRVSLCPVVAGAPCDETQCRQKLSTSLTRKKQPILRINSKSGVKLKILNTPCTLLVISIPIEMLLKWFLL